MLFSDGFLKIAERGNTLQFPSYFILNPILSISIYVMYVQMTFFISHKRVIKVISIRGCLVKIFGMKVGFLITNRLHGSGFVLAYPLPLPSPHPLLCSKTPSRRSHFYCIVFLRNSILGQIFHKKHSEEGAWPLFSRFCIEKLSSRSLFCGNLPQRLVWIQLFSLPLHRGCFLDKIFEEKSLPLNVFLDSDF